MVFRYPHCLPSSHPPSSASRSAHRSPAPLWWGFGKQPPAAVAPGYLLKGAGRQEFPDAK